MKRFLTFIVEQSLRAPDVHLKEYAIALAVYDKPASFDQRLDPIIRVEASRLRAKLRQYYEEEGRSDPIVISMRKRGYAAVVKRRRRRGVPAPVAFASSVEPAAQGTTNPEAHHFYLKARHCWNRRTPESISEGIAFFKEAVGLDPDYALAYAGLADCYASQAWLDVQAPQELWPLAEKAANRALQIDDSLAAPLATLACRQAVHDWDWSGAEASFRRAIRKEPSYATARHWYAIFCLAPQRRLNAALTEMTKACELDPLSPMIGTHLGWILYFRRQYQEALDQFRRTIELDPGFHLTYRHMAVAYVQASQFEEALKALEKAMHISHGAAADRAAQAFVYAAMGKRQDAENALRRLTTAVSGEYLSPVSLAMVYAALGASDDAFACLIRARDERSSRIIHAKIEPVFDPLKSDVRFVSLLSSVGLL